MNRHHKILVAAIMCIGLGMASCNKPDPLTSPNEGNIYMPQAYGSNATQTLYLIDSPQAIIFGAAYGGLSYPKQDITVEFKLDTQLIASYNADHGTSYVPLPTDHYTIASFSTVIKAGTPNSIPLPITVTTKGLSFGVRYMLPVTMISVSGGKFDSSLFRAYFAIDSLYTREKDVTSRGTLSVAYENTGGPDADEASKHLVDNDLTTKYLSQSTPPDFWFQETFSTAQVVNAYTFTSGNDSPDRDPMDWNMVASNDGANWDTLDVRIGETFPSRIQTRHFTLNNNSNTAYKYYRVNVTKKQDGGNGLFQMTEWRLLQYY